LPVSLRLGALLICLLPACGLLSRDEFLRRDLQPDTQPETLVQLRGIQPLNPRLWMYSAYVVGADTAEAALEIVERGLKFHPSDANLLRAQVDLQGQVNGPRAQVDAAHQVLRSGRPAALEAELRMLAVDGELRLDNPEAAAVEAIRLGATAGADPALISVSWARIALTQEFLGKTAEADESLDRSLDKGAAGMGFLPLETRRAPERIAAARSLVARAAERHPRHPDIAFYLAVDLLLQGNLDDAEDALDSLPAPLPWRLRSSETALRARIRLQQGRVDEALEMLGGWMDRYPRDTTAVAVLLEIWARLERPDDETMIARLYAARSRLHPPALNAQIEQTLQQLLARAPLEAGAD
jgi:tetratricopeptide (TPR) repeat protein